MWLGLRTDHRPAPHPGANTTYKRRDHPVGSPPGQGHQSFQRRADRPHRRCRRDRVRRPGPADRPRRGPSPVRPSRPGRPQVVSRTRARRPQRRPWPVRPGHDRRHRPHPDRDRAESDRCPPGPATRPGPRNPWTPRGGEAEYGAHRGRFEAEAVAHIVAAALGLDTACFSIAYVAGWAGTDAEKGPHRRRPERRRRPQRLRADLYGYPGRREGQERPAHPLSLLWPDPTPARAAPALV